MAKYSGELNIRKHRWKNRLILVLIPSKKSQIWEEQQEIFQKLKSENEQRRLLLIKIHNSDKGVLRKYKVLKQYPIVLIGLDGEVKAKYKSPVEMDSIYRLIDSMPMRRQEMEDSH